MTVDLEDSKAVAVATLDETGKLLAANAGFARLLRREGEENVAHLFLNPRFADLLRGPPTADGCLFRGLFTLGPYSGKTRTFTGRLSRQGPVLQFVGEQDPDALEALQDSVLALNLELSDARRQVARENRDLEARVAERTAALVASESELQRLYAQAQREVATKSRLLMEVNHRVKNNLLSLSGMVLMDRRLAKESGAPLGPEAFDRFVRRVEALLAAHDLLARGEWSAVPVAKLATEVVQRALAVGASRRQVTIAPSAIEVSPRQAGPLALVLAELATNTALHAPAAAVTVSAALEGKSLVATYRDDGPGYPAEVLRGERLGVGLRVARAVSEGTLRGALTLANDGGAVALVRLETEEPHRT
jgi:two-component sensor histidine kinase